MKTLSFLTVIERGPTSFGAFAPDVPGCVAFCRDRDAIQALFQSGLQAHLRELIAAGYPAPLPRTKEIAGLSPGVVSGALTLEWTTVDAPSPAHEEELLSVPI